MLPSIEINFLLVLMACCSHTVTCSSNGNYTDRLSLLEFKKAISDPQQALMSWNDSTHICSWEGVLCSVKHPHRVASLNLTNRNLVGQIYPSLGNLTFLKVLILSANSFTGEIPPSLGHLHHLQYLNLSHNTLQGRIPSFENCSRLKQLCLKSDQLVGQIPADLPQGLQKLILSNNNLTGTIPASLANITTITLLSCRNNNIKGNIPNEFANLVGLQYLYMGINKLSGRFPQPIMNLSNLVEFSVAYNYLAGDIPSTVGNSLPNLQLFELGVNFFHGHIPYSLANASKLYLIDMSRNNFTGVVPSSIGKLSELSWLNLEFNKLHARNKHDWEFMDSLANCTELQMFSAVHNHFQGNVPISLGNLSSQLQYLHLAENQLSGEFPSGIVNLHNLIALELGRNQFIGVVPEWLGTLKNLQRLSLGVNFFTGVIPASLANLSQLVELYLESNQFGENIPPILGNLQMLEVLSTANNNLVGSIPKELFTIPTIVQIDLSFNNLDGPLLHTDIGNAKQLTYLFISSNNLSGEIPSNLGNCESLEKIELGHNAFIGSIPTSLGKISSLQILNFSQNNLNGSIPASLGSLQHLEQLDLSFNNLDGEVPTEGIFKNATAIRVAGNQHLCGGLLELHLPACHVTPLDSSKSKLSVVKKVVIPVAIVVSLSIAVSVLLFQRRKWKTESISLQSFGRKFLKISYSDIVRATGGFATSNIIGQGRYGSVYQGQLFRDGNVVAIKVFSLETRGAQESFTAECSSLRNARHRNLVPILTACSTLDANGNDFKALVYEFMPRGDLHNLLYSTRRSEEDSPVLNSVSLAQRLSIVADVSDALVYLHHNHQGTIVHCDLKPSNILLDDDMVAHVGDFGLARFKFDSTTSSFTDSNSTSSVAIKGTIGYVAPECAGGGHVSTSSDVYSFGVVLLEIFIRRRPTDDLFKDGMCIAKFTEINFPDNVLRIVDTQLLQELELTKETPVAMKDGGAYILQSVLNIGLCCTKTSPSERISMQEAAARLHGIRDAYLREYCSEI